MFSSSKRWCFALALFLFSWDALGASLERQVTEPKALPAKAKALRVPAKVGVALPAVDPKFLKKGAKAKGEKQTPEIGVRREFPKAVVAEWPSKGEWTEVKGGYVWAREFESEGAFSLRVSLEKIELPPGARITLYNPDNPNETVGPYDAGFLNGRISFWGGAIFNSRLVVECFLPQGSADKRLYFEVTELSHRYRNLESMLQEKAAGSCNLDVSCYSDWLVNSRAVAAMTIITAGGESYCSGTLLADQDAGIGSHYFFTANHCVANQMEADDIEFHWFFQTSICNGTPPNIADVPRTVSGAEFLVTGNRDNSADFTLMRLRQGPPPGVTFAGWTTDVPTQNSSVVSVHHPDFDFKRISFGRVTTVLSNFWEIGWTQGITEPGSSGAPLFNSAGQVIGSLFGGFSSCSNPQGRDEYGRLDRSFPYMAGWLNNLATVVSNDSFASAAALNGNFGTVKFSSGGATKQIGEPNHAGNAGGMSVWYRWISPTNGTVSFNTLGSAFDTTLAVYTGTSVSGLTLAGENDDAFGQQSRVSFEAVQGTAYWIAVDGYDRSGGPGMLNWVPGQLTLVTNDNFDGAINLSGVRGDIIGTSRGATSQAGEPTHAGVTGGASVWYKWTAPRAGSVSFDTEGSSFDTVLGVYRGSSVSSLTSMGSNDDIPNASTVASRVVFTASAGTTYFIAVDGYDAEQGTVLLTWAMAESASAPVNDHFANARQITGTLGSTNVVTLSATQETGEPAHGATGGKSVWYSFTAPTDGTLYLNTAGSDFDTLLAIYTGTSLSTLVRLGSNDDVSLSSRSSVLGARVVANATYRIALDGVRTTSGTIRAGNGVLSWNFQAGGFNDHFSDAQMIGGSHGFVQGINSDATKEPGEPSHANNGGKSVWYRWIAPATGTVIFQTAESSFDTTLAAYTGNDIASLNQITSNDDANNSTHSEIRFLATAGVTYFIAVDGYNEGGIVGGGAFNLSWGQLTFSLGEAVGISGLRNAQIVIEASTNLVSWEKYTNLTLRTGIENIVAPTLGPGERVFLRARMAE